MARLVMKFGGTSVANIDRIRNVARHVKREFDAGRDVAVVVSAMSGKTTNLQSLHAMCSDTQRGEMFSVNTQEDRTLFFDLLPINLGYIYGNAIHLQIYTVPGQVQYDADGHAIHHTLGQLD